VLLGSGRTDDAGRYAEAVARRSEGAAAAPWLERAGDAAVFRDDLAAAIGRYEEAARLEPERASALLKLSDLYYATRDLERERHYRGKIYGTLRP
jgi:tetratricopeptide (TPR) repeat protein